jgi:hypothetical protein
VRRRERVERQQLLPGGAQQLGDLGQRWAQPVDRVGEPGPRLLVAVGLEDRPDHGAQGAVLVLARVAEHVPEEVHGAALPRA